MTFPLTAHRFFVSLDLIDAYMPPGRASSVPPTGIGRFSEITGLAGGLEVLSYVEGGQNDYVHELPVKHKWNRLLFKRGLVEGSTLWAWYHAGLNGTLGARRDGAIILLDPDGAPASTWTFRAGIATKWSGPDLNSMTGSTATLDATR